MFRGLDTRRDEISGWARLGIKRAATVAAVLALPFGALASDALAAPSLEYAIKAAYLYKLAAFVNWPPASFESSSSPLRICVIGEDPFKTVLDQAVSGVSVAGRPVQIARYDAVQPNMACQIAYVAGSPIQSRADALKILKGEPVLTVTDQGRGGDPASEEGVVNFVLIENRVRFDIDQHQAVEDHLALSGKLLSLAVEVRR